MFEVSAMDRFYFEIVFNWSIFLILFIFFAFEGRELLKSLIRNKDDDNDEGSHRQSI